MRGLGREVSGLGVGQWELVMGEGRRTRRVECGGVLYLGRRRPSTLAMDWEEGG